MKNSVVLGLLMVSLCILGSSSVLADYQPADRFPVGGAAPQKPKELPLMVVRFNQPHVLYEKALYDTVQRAFQVKPSAKFDVVSVAQRADNVADQKRYDGVAAKNTLRIMRTFQEMGLPPERINLTTITDTIQASEVRIFVR